MSAPNGGRPLSGQKPVVRLPTVENALQHTAFTSIVPFDADCVPLPSAAHAYLASPLLTPEEQAQSVGITSALKTSDQLQQALNDTREIVRSAALKPVKFKTSLFPLRKPGASSTSNGVDATPLKLRLDNFAAMSFNALDTSFRYPTPVSPAGAQRVKSRQSPADPQKIKTESAPDNKLHVLPSTPRNSTPLRQSQDHQTPTIRLSQETAPKYHNANVDDAILRDSKKPSTSARDDKADIRGMSVDQREAGNAALNELHDQINRIFEAEDQLEPDTSGAVSTTKNPYFFLPEVTGGTEHLLETSTHISLFNALGKVMTCRRFQEVSTDHLVRVQRLCHRSLLVAIDLHFAPLQDLDEHAADELEARYHLAENALRASRTVMKMMMGGRDDKQLYSEEILQDLLAATRHIFDNALVPLVEARPAGSSSEGSGSVTYHEAFANFKNLKAAAATLLRRASTSLKLAGDFLMQVEISEEAVGTVESLAVQLLFVENAANDKDSVLGVHSFEDARRRSMDVLAKVFLRFPTHRSDILTEMLSSLEKLPVGRQSARQFKIVNGKPIQVISALIMLLVQISATRLADVKKSARNDKVNDSEDDEESDSDDGDSESSQAALETIARPLIKEAQETAKTVIRFILSRALRVSKSSDEPYRNLLDIFTEDFVSVLGHTDWPAAELLLRFLLNMLLSITMNDKMSSPEKSMALELMGSLGSGIADLHGYIVRHSRNLEGSLDDLDKSLQRLCQTFVDEGIADWETSDQSTLCRAVAHFLPLRDDTDLQIKSAQSYVLTSAASELLSPVLHDEGQDDQDERDESKRAVFVQWVNAAIRQPAICHKESVFREVSTSQGQLAYALLVLGSPFCKGLKAIFDAFIRSLRSPHATVKSRALKSVILLLEKNEQIVHTSTGVIATALRAADDNSPSVRDSALTLLGKCLAIKPSLDSKTYSTLLNASADRSVAVRKKAIKLLKEVYQRNNGTEMRNSIADAIISCVADPESSVNELAKSTIEDMWMAEFYGAITATELSASAKRDIRKHAWHIVGTAELRSPAVGVMEELMNDLLNKAGRKQASNRDVAKAYMKQLFDGFIDNTQESESPSQSATMRTLTIFAKASPKLFDADQMKTLGPYLRNMTSEEDRSVYRSVVSIYCCVLPILPRLEQGFLADMSEILKKSLSKLGSAELKEVVQCIWIINDVIQETSKLANLARSILMGILQAKSLDLNGEDAAATAQRQKTQRYIMIAGPVGKYWDLTGQERLFQQQLDSSKSRSVPELMVHILIPFLDKRQPRAIRVQALESVGMICQSWPENFAKHQVVAAFEEVFQSQDTRMESSILEGILEFYKTEELRSKSGAEVAIGEGAAMGAVRLGKSLAVTEHDGAATSLAQRFLSHILRIALASYDASAWIAVQTIASINRQGLVHPKECAAAIVALETSPNPHIAKTASLEHADLHQKHESMLGKEYVFAIETAYNYQRDIVKQDSGVNDDATPKLKPFFEVLKAGTSNLRKKLYTDVVRKLDFNATRSLKGLENRIPYTTFVIENFALSDFVRTDDVMQLHSSLEKVFTDTGNLVSQMLEPLMDKIEQEFSANQSEVQMPEPDAPSSVMQLSQPEQSQTTTASFAHRDELRNMTVATIILSMLWEGRNYLRRAWSLPAAGKKMAGKDASKAPVKSNNASPEGLVGKISALREISLDDDVAMVAQCKSFLQALSIDNEHKVASGDEDEAADGERIGTPVADGNVDAPGSHRGSGRPRKRRLSVSASIGSVTPSKRSAKKQKQSMPQRKSSTGKRPSYAEDDSEDGDDDVEEEDDADDLA